MKKKKVLDVGEATPIAKDEGILDLMEKAIDESYDNAIAVRIISGVASGLTIGRMKFDGLIPIDCNPYIWCMRYPEFAKALADAKKVGAEYLAEQTIDIADGILECANPAIAFKARQYVAGTRDKRYSAKGDDTIETAISELPDNILDKEMQALAERIFKDKQKGAKA